MNNPNAAQNNNHQLVGIANHLITLFKVLTEYQVSDRIENSITRNLEILNTTLSGTLRSELAARLKQTFDAILHAIIDGFRFRSGLHDAAVEWKSSVQETFNSVVDFAINIESQLLKDQKQDLLGDIHTQLTNAITSRMLMDKLLPTFKFKSKFVLYEMIRRLGSGHATETDENPMNVRPTFDEAQMNKLLTILQRIETEFNIKIRDILEMLLRKRERNDGKHYDSRIQAHINTHQGRARQFRTFIARQGLLRAFDDDEINQTQRMYADHCRFSAIDWHKRFRPSEHIWVYSSEENRCLAVYVRPEDNEKHRVWHYNNYNGGIRVHSVKQLEKLSV